jgi:hypothetical protein
MRRCIGLDVHREFAQVAIWEDGVIWQAGRIQTTPEALPGLRRQPVRQRPAWGAILARQDQPRYNSIDGRQDSARPQP